MLLQVVRRQVFWKQERLFGKEKGGNWDEDGRGSHIQMLVPGLKALYGVARFCTSNLAGVAQSSLTAPAAT